MNNLNTESLISGTKGNVILPSNDDYDEARKIWNGIFDRKPACIVQCETVSDVVESVNFARENNLLLAVKGGGHNSAGTSVCDDGLMIDLAKMNAVEVEPSSKTVRVQGGCLLSDVDKATQEHGLAVSGGIISHTGVGGLTLGGGMGWISRKYGLSIDNLLSANVVTASGQVVTASQTENQDLFWAIRGGGGNFGIVTSFEFKCADFGTEVYSGPIVKKFDDIKEYIQFHRDFVRTMPDNMTVWMVVRHAPPLPFIPEEYHGKLVVLVLFVWIGEESVGSKLIQPVRDFKETIGDGSAMHPWIGWQSAFDGLVEHGARNYWKSHHLTSMSDELIDVIKEYVPKMPTDECELFMPHMEGAPSKISPEATAYYHRNTPFVLNIHTRWRNESDDEKCLQWAREFHKATEPFGKGVYVNFVSETSQDRVKASYSPEIWDKLVKIKTKWDPDNLFSLNLNISPNGV